MAEFKTINVPVKIQAGTIANLEEKAALLTAIGNLDAGVQSKLIQLAKSPKALKALESKWPMLKAMLL